MEEISNIKIAVLKIKLYAPWVHSLKEKRMIVKSLLAKLRNQFQISTAEVEDQDIHQSIVIGMAAITDMFDCMSFPNLLVRVRRYRHCILRYRDEKRIKNLGEACSH